MSWALFFTVCILASHLSKTYSMTLRNPEKKGWTLNSAGYLLGPYAHRSLNVKHRAAVGKRDMWNDISSLPTYRNSYNDSYLPSLLAHLAYLQLKEMGMTEDFSSTTHNVK
ncbi:galanin peptides-like [Triplophysa rosa]|uniref:Galanin peptides-like n=1 Tax=Triplophysa rosa TaxID=992332 RepID=A0A9W7WE75_TRIRA|nr:galanin peptides-like [Triplophysa rosa]KAI7796666.1 putative galanin peptides-like [Triplophysa rosa]